MITPCNFFYMGNTQLPDESSYMCTTTKYPAPGGTSAEPPGYRVFSGILIELDGSNVALATGMSRSKTSSNQICMIRAQFNDEVQLIFIQWRWFQMFFNITFRLLDLVVTLKQRNRGYNSIESVFRVPKQIFHTSFSEHTGKITIRESYFFQRGLFPPSARLSRRRFSRFPLFKRRNICAARSRSALGSMTRVLW